MVIFPGERLPGEQRTVRPSRGQCRERTRAVYGHGDGNPHIVALANRTYRGVRSGGVQIIDHGLDQVRDLIISEATVGAENRRRLCA
jgi:hypothetical protein